MLLTVAAVYHPACSVEAGARAREDEEERGGGRGVSNVRGSGCLFREMAAAPQRRDVVCVVKQVLDAIGSVRSTAGGSFCSGGAAPTGCAKPPRRRRRARRQRGFSLARAPLSLSHTQTHCTPLQSLRHRPDHSRCARTHETHRTTLGKRNNPPALPPAARATRCLRASDSAGRPRPPRSAAAAARAAASSS
jgi:hypothetical protein